MKIPIIEYQIPKVVWENPFLEFSTFSSSYHKSSTFWGKDDKI